MDWSLGQYERIAAQLQPAAEVLVDAAEPGEGDRVVDLGCGIGNAALIAAARGARVTGIDPARRLLDIAAARADELGLDVAFLEGRAEEIPLEDGVADLLLSVFGVVFAEDAGAAAAEMARVTSVGGRIVFSAWIPQGPISEAARIGREAIAGVLGLEEPAPSFAWHDQEALAESFAKHGFAVTTEEHPYVFTAASPQVWIEEETRNHPLQVAGAAVLESRGEAEAVRERIREHFEAANEDPSAFKVTSRYVVVTARRGS